MLASARLFPKFVSERAAMYHELRKPGTRPYKDPRGAHYGNDPTIDKHHDTANRGDRRGIRGHAGIRPDGAAAAAGARRDLEHSRRRSTPRQRAGPSGALRTLADHRDLRAHRAKRERSGEAL